MLNTSTLGSRRLTTSMVKPKSFRNPMTSLTSWWRKRAVSKPEPRYLSLALQGGGAHGAFTWGVLDALLEDSTISFDALSGSSAGAVNSVVMTQGWMQGGIEGARQALSDFWLDVGKRPDGHFKFPHLWPVKFPQAGRLNYRLFGLPGSVFLWW
jgi:predicted acylesterase/phospholipase RssA